MDHKANHNIASKTGKPGVDGGQKGGKRKVLPKSRLLVDVGVAAKKSTLRVCKVWSVFSGEPAPTR